MRQFTFLLLALSSAVFCQAATSNSFPVTVLDDRNKQVVFQEKPNSIASVSSFGADLLTALGKQATGISSFNHQLPTYLGNQVGDVVDLGEIHETNLEQLTELNPDLTIGIRAYTEPFEKKFEEVGKLLAYDLVTYEDSIRAIDSAATALGEPQRAAHLNAAFANSLKAHAEKAPGGLSAVFLWFWADVPYGFYDHHFTIMMMKSLKVENLIGPSPKPEIKRLDSAPISMETLLTLDPDVIISFKGGEGPFPNHLVWPRLRAFKQGRAYRVGEQFVMPHGPIAREMVLRELAYVFYPDLFPKPTDIPEAARAAAMTFTAD